MSRRFAYYGSTGVAILFDVWMDGSDLTTITKDGSDFVSIWDDKGINTLSYAQGSTINQPLYLTTGNPRLSFDGSNDRLIASSFNKTDSEGLYFFVFKYDSSKSNNRLFSQGGNPFYRFSFRTSQTGGGGTADKFALLVRDTNSIHGAGNNIFETTTSLVNGNTYVIACYNEGGVVKMRINGVQDTVNNPVGTYTDIWHSFVVTMGAESYFAFCSSGYGKQQISEMRYKSGTLTLSEIQSVETELMSKYTIP